ncbi:acetylornithine deacetylase [Paracoccus broussonetiae]|nr:acetylornithine deacetylase [Paracoccus sp. CPCC 101403]
MARQQAEFPMTPEEILADLISCDDLPGRPNRAIAGCVEGHLRRMGIEPVILTGPEGDRVNILATIGPRDRSGVILSGHMDVVPVAGQDWSSDPFRLTRRDDRLYGRGTSDMKGFLACMLAMVPEFQAATLQRPLHLAFSYDEEIGCRGVGHLIAALPDLVAAPMACIVGEPSAMRPVLSHKGKRSTLLRIEGRAAHSSQPDAGLNAIYAGAEILLAIRALNERLAVQGPFDHRFSPPHSTVVAGVVRGGSAVNIIPDRCEIEMEVRSVPGADPAAITAEIVALAQALVPEKALSVEACELSAYPALPPSSDPTLAGLVARLSGGAPLQSVSYGTEAGLYHAAGIPSIICGPGEIARAHRPDEFILPEELAHCCQMLRGLAGHLAAP